MRILCEMGHPAQASIVEGWGRVFGAAGHSYTLWDPSAKPAFDAFDESDPELFIRMGPLIRPVARCIEERKRMVVIEQSNAQPAGDTFLYMRGAGQPSLACDFCYVGNYREDKRRLLDSYVALLSQRGSIKIFGGGGWPYYQYLGSVSDSTAANVYASSKVCVNTSSSGRTNQRVYNILLAGGVCVSNRLQDGVFEPSLVLQAESSTSFRDAAVMMASSKSNSARKRLKEQGRSAVLSSHTYWHRCRDILEACGFGREAEKVMEVYYAAVRV